jgi:hypothetical protein
MLVFWSFLANYSSKNCINEFNLISFDWIFFLNSFSSELIFVYQSIEENKTDED